MTASVREQILARLSFPGVFGEYVQLRKSGRSWVGLCPFHHEKTPSFHVEPQKGLYYCFGCKAGGDVFDFVMKMEGLTFREALAFLAEKAGLEMSSAKRVEDSPEARLRRDLIEVNELACSFYQRVLLGPGGEKAREYLRSRGLDPRWIRHFRLGYAPDRWDGLTGYLVDIEKAGAGLQAGLLVAKRTGGAYDRFRGRIMFPFVDVNGKVVAFGGRTLGSEEPKYLNSPETAVYVKSRQLYGLAQAKEAMRRERRVVVVEGYFDCIALQRSGVGYTVASCGTALTREHVRLLRRFVSDVYLCFDADSAGRRAIAGASEVLRGSGMRVWVIVLPAGHDPDTFIAAEGRTAFLSEMKRALPLTDYLLEEAIAQADMRTVAGRMQGVRAAVPILRSLKSPVERDAYIQRVASRLGISPRSLAREVSAQADRGFKSARHTNAGYRDTSTDQSGVTSGQRSVLPDGRALLERDMVRCLIHDTSGIRSVVEELGLAPFRTECYNKILRALAEGGSFVSIAKEMEDVLSPELIAILAQPPESGLSWQDYLQRMCLERMREELRTIEEGLVTLEEHNPVEYVTQMSKSLQAFRAWRKALKNYSRTQSEAS
ncbi:MAG: DNA primase [Firmicutes bacterium]|nr:DNA primase [Bacillota bacterium]